MNSTKVATIVQKVIKKVYTLFPVVNQIVMQLQSVSPSIQIVVVGGTVRDAFLDMPLKDIDIEVYGIDLNDLEKVLRTYGVVRKVGKAFGVLRIDGFDIDWSVPRADGPGRKPEVYTDPYLSYEKAFARRDLTVNAMGIHLVSGQLIDPFDGVSDIENKVLRVPDQELFKEDPLRYFRVMQFMGRFQFIPDKQLYEIGTAMDVTGISFERIDEEFYKLCVLSQKPSLGLQWLYDTQRLQKILPELFVLIGVAQDPVWHPEGDAFEHTKQAVDAAALQTYVSDTDRYVMVLAALCHDLGKSIATQFVDGRIRSHGHDVEGVKIAQTMLQRITRNKDVIARVLKLVRWHMTPVALVKNKAGAAAYKRLALRLAPETSCTELALLAVCDKSGRNPDKTGPLLECPEPLIEQFLEQAQKYGVAQAPEKAILMGKDLEGIIQPGPKMGEILKNAYKIQIENGITDKELLKKKVIKG